MFKQHRAITFLLGMTILLVMILVLSGCGGPTPAPTPTPGATAIAATPVVTILKNPNITEVTVGQMVALSAEATGGPNLKFEWIPKRGKVSKAEGLSTIYTTPDTPGLDTVDVIVTSDSGTTTKTVTFTVVEALTETPTLTLIPPTVTLTASPPPPPGAVAITLSVDNTTASGQVSGLDPDQYPAYKVLVYLKTDILYIQPVLGGFTSIKGDGTWQMSELKLIPGVSITAYAYLARRDFQALDVSSQEPEVDGVNIIAKAEPVKVQ